MLQLLKINKQRPDPIARSPMVSVKVAIKRARLARVSSIFDAHWQLTKHASTPLDQPPLDQPPRWTSPLPSDWLPSLRRRT